MVPKKNISRNQKGTTLEPRGEAFVPCAEAAQGWQTLVPKAIPFMVFGSRVLEYWLLAPFGHVIYTIPYYTIPYYIIYHTILLGPLLGTWALWGWLCHLHISMASSFSILAGPQRPHIHKKSYSMLWYRVW